MNIARLRKRGCRASTLRDHLHFEPLEDRRLFAADIMFSGGLLSIDGDHQSDVINVNTLNLGSPQSGLSFLRVQHGHTPKGGSTVIDGVRFFPTSIVDTIRFRGFAGNDRFSNNTSIVSTAYGGDGSDILVGGSSADRLYGQDGNDRLYGRFGNDFLYGGLGADRLFGGFGNDTLNSSSGVDMVFGGAGTDRLVEHVDVNGFLGTNRFYNTGGGVFEMNTLNSIERASLYGDASDNVLVARGFNGPVTIHGYGGEDLIMGSQRSDSLYGGTGDDRIYGYGGNDRIRPGLGADLIDGGTGTDRVLATVNGDVDLDNTVLEIMRSTGLELNELIDVERASIRAVTSNDVLLDAGDFSRGNVYLVGGSGNDELIGGFQNDVLSGGGGKDLIWGMAGNDRLYGGSGNDRLLGGSGTDRLYGGSGNDGMNGGLHADTLNGGSGMDRYLWQAGDSMVGYSTTNDVRIVFENTTTSTTITSNGNSYTYTARNWADDEIRIVDEAFESLQDRTDNNVLLRTANGSEITYRRLGAASTSFVAWNSGTLQQFADGTFSNTDGWIHQVVFHEIGHNWDNENPEWDDFQAISGWTTSDMSSNSNFSAGAIGNWYHLNSANFARNYGKSNPREDFATAFAAYFKDYMGESFSGGGAINIPTKMIFMEDFIDDLTTA